MKTKLDNCSLLTAVALFFAAALPGLAGAALLDNSFTYQGQLRDANGPANGSFDFRFALFKVSVNGGSVGTITNSGVAVSNGFFTTSLLFTNITFDGTAYWLSVAVRTNGNTGNFTVLSPRQLLTAAPNALYSMNAGYANTAGNTTNLPANSVSADKLTPDIGVWTKSGTVIYYTGGRVGIGTNSPADDLHVAGDILAGGQITSGDRFIAAAGTDSRPGYTFSGDGNTGLYHPAADVVALTTGSNERMRIQNNGRVGIGTSSPSRVLDVNGDVQLRGTSGGTGLIVDSTGNVGIGTTTPEAQLEIQPSSNADSVLRVTSPGTGVYPSVYNSTLQLVDVQSNGWSIFKDQANNLSLRDAKTGVERTRFQANGNVSIGGTVSTNIASRILTIVGDSSAAQYAGTAGILLHDPLHGSSWSVSTYTTGDLHFDKIAGAGNEVVVPILTIVGGSDLAEPFNINGDVKPEPGMVVAIDPNGTGELRVCTRAYDPTVAGIISGAGGVKTGMTLKQSGTVANGNHPVALTGRVYCDVDTDAGGPVEPGDMLTSSDTPGYAMKVTNHARALGATLGKAMTPLKSGKGLVLVLVTLQ